MSQREQYMLSWEAATERLLDAAALPEGSPRVCERPESTAAYAAHTQTKGPDAPSTVATSPNASAVAALPLASRAAASGASVGQTRRRICSSVTTRDDTNHGGSPKRHASKPAGSRGELRPQKPTST